MVASTDYSSGAEYFRGKIALVTGGGTGIGRAAATTFARQGATVVVAGRREAELNKVADEIAQSGGAVYAIPADITQADQVERLIAEIVDRFGGLDAAFNNAGTEGRFAPIVDLAEDDFDRVIATNLKGTWLAIKHEVAAMLRLGRAGAIVNTSSWLADGASVGSSVYSASKGGLDAMIRAIALETADKGIRINNVRPGIIDTPMARRFVDDEGLKPFIANTPARRVGLPEDVAEVAVWLCTNAAQFVTGQSLMVDGGYTIGGIRS